MADKNGRERLSLYFNIKNEKEAYMWEYIGDKYSKSAFVKEAIEEKILREKAGVNLNTLVNKENIKDPIEKKSKIKKSDIDPNLASM